MQELEIIDLIGRMTRNPSRLLDDAFYDADTRQIYTTDLLIENQHFRMDYFSPEDLGWKAAAVNISDIAAMGGRPRYLLISLGLPEGLDSGWLEAFYSGLLAACQVFGCEIAGGDTVGSDRIVVNVTAIGDCPAGHTVGQRTGARPGDVIIATGPHGLSHIGMRALQTGLPGCEACKRAHLRPQPRVEAGLMLSERFERYALMDSSDGLADALLKIAKASGCRMIVDAEKMPLHPELADYCDKNGLDPWQTTHYGGEDFELIATVPQAALSEAGGKADAHSLELNSNDFLSAHFKVIGRVEAAGNAPGAYFLPPGAETPVALSLSRTYQHFEAGR